MKLLSRAVHTARAPAVAPVRLAAPGRVQRASTVRWAPSPRAAAAAAADDGASQSGDATAKALAQLATQLRSMQQRIDQGFAEVKQQVAAQGQRLAAVEQKQQSTIEELAAMRRELTAMRREQTRQGRVQRALFEAVVRVGMKCGATGEKASFHYSSLRDLAGRLAQGAQAGPLNELEGDSQPLPLDEASILKRLCAELDPHVRRYARGVACALQTVPSDAQGKLRGLKSAYDAHKFVTIDGQVDTAALFKFCKAAGADQGLTVVRTLSRIKDYLEASAPAARQGVLCGTLGLTLAVWLASDVSTQWPFDEKGNGSSGALTAFKQLYQGYEKLELDARGVVQISTKSAHVRVEEVKLSKVCLEDGWKQLQLRLAVLTWAIRVGTETPDLPVQQEAILHLPMSEDVHPSDCHRVLPGGGKGMIMFT